MERMTSEEREILKMRIENAVNTKLAFMRDADRRFIIEEIKKACVALGTPLAFCKGYRPEHIEDDAVDEQLCNETMATICRFVIAQLE